MRNSLIAHFIDLIDVGISSISSQSIKIWFIYIQPPSNPSDVILNNIFGQMSLRALLAGDFNAYNLARGSSECEFKGNLLNSTAVSFNLCILNMSSQDTAWI